MTFTSERSLIDIHREWIGYVQPVGLVVSPAALIHRGCVPDRDIAPHQRVLNDLLTDDEEGYRLVADLPSLFNRLLDWQSSDLAGGAEGSALPDTLSVFLPEFGETLSAKYAVHDSTATDERGWLLLVRDEPLGTDFDAAPTDDGRGWAASPQDRFERLLRETGVPAGLLANGRAIRLVYAPRGETSGHATFGFAQMAEISGRPILAAFLMLLSGARLFGHPDSSLPSLLAESRRFQATVSARLAQQVLGALHDLLRGLDVADARIGSNRIRTIAAEKPEHLYEGLLTTLMRLVFILYAEDRGLFPANDVWVRNYSLGGLFSRLREDVALHPDTMDDRFGAWSQLVAVWRLIHSGGRHGDGLRLAARRGRLFDPDRFPFLEGRDSTGDHVAPPPVSDGVIWSILSRLLVLDGERLSYRALDVEQIGSVYETMMGFTVQLTEGHSLAVRSNRSGGASAIINLDALLAESPAKRAPWLQIRADRKPTEKAARDIRNAKSVDDLAVALAGVQDVDATQNVVPPGIPVLQPTPERRRSGSHYTPRSLTEPIVRDALYPVLGRLGAKPTPNQILDLKVLDPAMGSGAFLVEACRQLGECLVSSWAAHDVTPALPADEDVRIHARRLVAQRCLYGVDRNRLAAELGKLSIWLATLARDHEFTFVDHAVRNGDSLVGLTRREIERTDAAGPHGLGLGPQFIGEKLAKATEVRSRIRTAAEGSGEDTLQPLLEEADHATAAVRRIGDALVAAFFSADKPRDREKQRLALVEAFDRGGSIADQALEEFEAQLEKLQPSIRPFHWEIEFPEVFQRDQPGFDVIIGNPPFAGKNAIADANPKGYLNWLQAVHQGAHGNADLVAHFFRRAFGLLRDGGTFGLIATNTIRQGDTRSTGLRWIRKNGGCIYAARRRLRWPGQAAVIVSTVHVTKSAEVRPAVLDEKPVDRITAFLVDRGGDDDPFKLVANEGRGFVGSFILGMGFTFDDTDQKGLSSPISKIAALLDRDPRNAERIRPYIGGEEVNNDPKQQPHRWVINFENFPLRRASLSRSWGAASEEERKTMLRNGIVPEDYLDRVAADWPDLLAIVEERVKPARDRNADESRRKYWWRFTRRAPELYAAIRTLSRVLVQARVSEHLAFTFLPNGYVYSDALLVFDVHDHAGFAVLQSRIHEIWAHFNSSSMKDDPRYSIEDAFETFPMPPAGHEDALEAAGITYYSARSELLSQLGCGLTPLYNRFHDPDDADPPIVELRRLHRCLDDAVLGAYGWTDLEVEPIFEREWEDESVGSGAPWRLRWPEEARDELLARLVVLNRERAREEQVFATGRRRIAARAVTSFDERDEGEVRGDD